MLPVLDDLARARTRLRRAMTARSHRNSEGRGHVAGTRINAQKIPNLPCVGWGLLLRREVLLRVETAWVNQITVGVSNLSC